MFCTSACFSSLCFSAGKSGSRSIRNGGRPKTFPVYWIFCGKVHAHLPVSLPEFPHGNRTRENDLPTWEVLGSSYLDLYGHLYPIELQCYLWYLIEHLCTQLIGVCKRSLSGCCKHENSFPSSAPFLCRFAQLRTR